MSDRSADQPLEGWLTEMPEAAWARAMDFALDPASTPLDDLVPEADASAPEEFDLDDLRALDTESAPDADHDPFAEHDPFGDHDASGAHEDFGAHDPFGEGGSGSSHDETAAGRHALHDPVSDDSAADGSGDPHVAYDTGDHHAAYDAEGFTVDTDDAPWDDPAPDHHDDGGWPG